jgi:hypothetical protein
MIIKRDFAESSDWEASPFLEAEREAINHCRSKPQAFVVWELILA